MDKAYELWKEIKCIKCVHGELCMQRLGGTDLTIAYVDCKDFIPDSRVKIGE
jgi:hypothetical protein